MALCIILLYKDYWTSVRDNVSWCQTAAIKQETCTKLPFCALVGWACFQRAASLHLSARRPWLTRGANTRSRVSEEDCKA
jgi:hypothetical protein